MRARTLILLVVLILIGVFAVVNWKAIIAPTTLSFLVADVQAPLGLIMLGISALLTVLFLLYLVYLHTSVLLESRRQSRELQGQRELADKDRLEEVLIEIFAEFIQRWGTEFGEFQEHHLMDLNATCTELIAGSNRRPVSNLVHLAPPATDDFKKNKLPEEILHSVEQELRLGRPESSPTERPLTRKAAAH